MRRSISTLFVVISILTVLSWITYADSPTSYVVQAGDTLDSIAWRFGVSTSRLAKANALSYPYSLKSLGGPLYIPNPAFPAPRPTPDDQLTKGMYITFYGIGYAPLREHMQQLLVDTELNAVVIDIKGDRGWVPYTSTVALAEEIGAQDQIMIKDVPALMEWFEAHDIYTIARIVVFKDNPLATHHPEWAVRDRVSGGLWIDREKLAWADPFRQEVWDYNIALAVEAAEQGFDEIQFDYVRFPTDGDVKRALFSEEATEESRRKAISGFLARAREKLKPQQVRLSVDVFGYTCWRLNDMGIGQVLEDIAPYVDVISPMVYPSTYVGGGGLPGGGYREAVPYPYQIVHYSVRRAVERVAGSGATIRPWLQDFPDYAYDRRVYTPAEIRAQMQGARWAGSSGWLLWDPRVRYTTEALKPAS